MKRPPACTFSIRKIHERALFPVSSTRKSTLTASPLEGYAHSLSLYLSLFLSLPLSPLSPVQSASESDDADDGNWVPNFLSLSLDRTAGRLSASPPAAPRNASLAFLGQSNENLWLFLLFYRTTHTSALQACLDGKLRSCIFMWLWCSFAESLVSSATYFKQNPWFFLKESRSHYWKIEPVER